VLLVFALGALLALAIAGLVALPIINRALRPLRQVTETAEAIAAGRLEERADLASSRDEIGRLGEAFDAMVDRLQEAIAAAETSEERMRRFLADVSHELRTPVTVLRGASQVLLRQGSDERPDHIAALRDMHDEATRLARLVDDLLTLSRLDARQSLAPEDVPLRPFLHQLTQRYGTLWPEREIIVDDAKLDGALIRVDPDALRRIVTNLVDNAARYSRPEGAITITGDTGPSNVSISIADEGPGLSPQDAARVFDRFYRARAGRKSIAGTGLGLAIVRGLVEQSGGSIRIDTAPSRGTTVTVTLPQFATSDV
jgi:two-component system OmpR family sensor kinase